MLTDVVRDRRAELLAYAALCTPTRSDAEAVLREALVRAFSGRRRPRTADDAVVAIRTAVRAVCAHRAEAAAPAAARPAATASMPPSPVGSGDTTAGQLVDTRAALAALTPRQRLCVVAHHVDDLPVGRIADDLRTSEADVRRELVAGTTTLRRVVGARAAWSIEEIRSAAPPAAALSQGRAS